MSPYDATAASFERHRALPEGVAEAVRSAVLAALATPSRPCLLDLGAGTGRIGRPFVEAEDDYVGVDLSFGMLSEFRRRIARRNARPRLVQADGRRLPFKDATFDAVMLIQVLSRIRSWQRLLDEASRVLRSTGALVLGRTVAPVDGVDAAMKQRLRALLDEMGVDAGETSARQDAGRYLNSIATSVDRRDAATWTSARSPRMFLERHRGGASFSALPAPIRERALGGLADWAVAAFGSLDDTRAEPYAFELQVFKLGREAGG
jgi:ubiquinone/menaquinone biosynthesis C-methylase UbiE